MKTILILIFLLLSSFTLSMAANDKTVTFFQDGTMVEIVAVAVKGVAEIPLPSDIKEGSLRIYPLNNIEIKRVDIIATVLEAKREKEIESLYEQKSRLEDRLQALATREDIFRGAAKSQSAKAPRKTKTNPEPMQSIRQGTDYAITQLEAVYTAKRKSEHEIKRINAKIAELRKGSNGAEKIAKVTLSSPNGKIKARYAIAKTGWIPEYEVRFNNNIADVYLLGTIMGSYPNARIMASINRISDFATATKREAGSTGSVLIEQYRLPVIETTFNDAVTANFSSTLSNTTNLYLPSGTATLYNNGGYIGKTIFEGMSSGRSRKIVLK